MISQASIVGPTWMRSRIWSLEGFAQVFSVVCGIRTTLFWYTCPPACSMTIGLLRLVKCWVR